MTPPAHIYTQGRANELHSAIRRGDRFWRRVETFLDRGLIDINHRDDTGATPLLYATWHGTSRVVKMLLDRGADVAEANNDGFTALHAVAMRGEPVMTGSLVEAGAPLDTVQPSTGTSALHMAAQVGHDEVVDVLVRAGAKVDKQAITEETPLYMAASRGQVRVVRVLLHAKADPLLVHISGVSPLEIAVKQGYTDVVREILQVGLVGCGGFDGGHRSLVFSAGQRKTCILKMLLDQGVVDQLGRALCNAVSKGREESVKFLLGGAVPAYKVIDKIPLPCTATKNTKITASVLPPDDVGIYVNIARDRENVSAAQCVFKEIRVQSCRMLRMLFDAGLDPDLTERENLVSFTDNLIREREEEAGYDPMEEKALGLQGVRRLLLQQKAIHAASWRWLSSEAGFARTSSTAAAAPTATSSAQLRRMQPILRRRAAKPSVLMSALFRQSHKLDRSFLGYESEAGDEHASEET